MAGISNYLLSFKRFLWSAPPVPVFIGISIISLILSVQILVVISGRTHQPTRTAQIPQKALTDAR